MPHPAAAARRLARLSGARAATVGLVGLAGVLALAGCGVSSASGVAIDSTSGCASIYPSPGTRTAGARTQVSIRGVHGSSLAAAHARIAGSSSGAHDGHWVVDSDTDGASFYPAKPFAAAETVTVALGVPVCGSVGTSAVGNSAKFTIAHAPEPLAPSKPQPAAGAAAPLDQPSLTYASAPGLKVPKLSVRVPANFNGQYIFETPRGGTKPGGPMIVDGHGNVVWFRPLPTGTSAMDFRTQTYQGQPVLTWWEGGINNQNGEALGGRFVIMNSHYQIIKTFDVANGYGSDEHEFLISPSGDSAWIVAADVVGTDLYKLGGSTNGAVIDQLAQEVDLPTGNVLFEWHSLDHVPVSDSYQGFSPSVEYDYFHMNSIDPQSSGTVVISSRHTHAVYAVDQQTGAVRWQLGGKHSTFSMGPGATFALQHDARMQGPNTITIFDDEDAAPDYAPARAITLHLNFTTKTATLARALTHKGLKVFAMGNGQVLANGDTMVGWGFAPATTVFGPTGTQVFDASFGKSVNSYRAYLLPWSGTPTTPPSVAATSAGGTDTVYASWNGDTQTAQWVVHGGSSPNNLAPITTATRTGFQTAITLPSPPRVIQVVAEDADGHTLGVSRAITPTTAPLQPVTITP